MSPITTPASLDFQSTRPLSSSAQVALNKAFEAGWLEPQKLHHGSAALRKLLQESRESIAANLKVPTECLEFVGELGFGYWSALEGALKEFSGTFIYGETDRQVVHAFARERINKGARSSVAPVNRHGHLNYQEVFNNRETGDESVVLLWQATNRETGVQQPPLDFAIPKSSLLIADMTANFHVNQLPNDWGVALWDPRNFGGPEGLSILAIRGESIWRSPIPQIDNRKLFGSYSKPLLILTAIALEEWVSNQDRELSSLNSVNAEFVERVKQELSDVELVGFESNRDPRNIALAVKGVAGEEILRQLEKREILIDAGSACGAGALSPSHVLEAMGFGQSGHLRITLKPNHSTDDLQKLTNALKEEIERFRAGS